MTTGAGDIVHNDVAQLDEGGDLAAYLVEYALRQLTIVMTPRIMQLRRLVIGEVIVLPELARVLYERGPARAMAMLAVVFQGLAERNLLAIDKPEVAAEHFNWLIMSAPLNQAMLLGDDAIPSQSELQRNAEAGVRVFLAAYGKNRP